MALFRFTPPSVVAGMALTSDLRQRHSYLSSVSQAKATISLICFYEPFSGQRYLRIRMTYYIIQGYSQVCETC